MSRKLGCCFAAIVLISSLLAMGASSEEGVLFLCHWNEDFDADEAGGDKTGLPTGGPKITDGYPFQTSKPDANGVLCLGGTFITYMSEGNFNADEGTIEFWVQPQWDGKALERHYLMELRGGQGWGQNNFCIRKCGFNAAPGDEPTSLYIHSYDDAQTEHQIQYAESTNWMKSTWHHLAVTFSKKEGKMRLFIDGNEVGSNNFIPMKTVPLTITFGSGPGGNWPSNALFDEFRILNYAQTSEEVREDYEHMKAGRELGTPIAVFPIGRFADMWGRIKASY